MASVRRTVQFRHHQGRWVAWCTCGCRATAGSWLSEADLTAKVQAWPHHRATRPRRVA